MTDVPDPVREREEALRVQLAGASSVATRDEAEAGLAAAQQGLSRGYDVGLGFVKVVSNENDAVRLLFVVTDGTRKASFFAFVSESYLAQDDEARTDLAGWSANRLYQIAGGFTRAGDRYVEMLAQPFSLG